MRYISRFPGEPYLDVTLFSISKSWTENYSPSFPKEGNFRYFYQGRKERLIIMVWKTRYIDPC